MPYRVFAVPLSNADEAIAELNQFLASHKVIDVARRFHADGAAVSWHFCVTYASRNRSEHTTNDSSRFGGVDYKKELPPADFSIFSRLRELRKQIAAETSAQLFAILTNKQLAEIAKRRVTSLTQLREIAGIGEKKVAAFGERILKAIAEVQVTTDQPTAREADSQERTGSESSAQRSLF